MKHILFLILAVTPCFAAFSQITEVGIASFYDDKFEGRITASGEIFSQKQLTAAHRTFPFGTQAKVTNLDNKKTVVVTINDRGPFVSERVIDLSRKAAKELGFATKGTAKVKVEVLKLGSENSVPVAKTPVAQPQTEKPAPVIKQEPQPVVTAPEAAGDMVEYFKLEPEKIEPKGFGIQIASYQDASNLIKRCSEIKSQTTNDVIVQVADNQGKKVYRIIIGTFATRELADAFMKKQASWLTGGFVVGF